MSLSVTPYQQTPFIPVNDLLQQQGQRSLVRPIKEMESPVSRGINGFCIAGILLWLKDIAVLAMNKNNRVSSTSLPLSLLAGVGLGILQKMRIDEAKKNPNQDLIIRNHFTGRETVVKNDSSKQDPFSSSIIVATRKFESPLSMGVVGTGVGLALYAVGNAFWMALGRKQLVTSSRNAVVGSAVLGGLWGLLQKFQIEGAKGNKDANYNIIIKNSLTGNEKVIKNRNQLV